MAHRDTLMRITEENKEIVKQNGYDIGDRHVELPGTLEEHQEVMILRSERLDRVVDILMAATPPVPEDRLQERCAIAVADLDSFAYPTDMVLNFANAHVPGGGYLMGASAQEEALCRQSTLYASIASRHAHWVYDYNSQFGHAGTDVMLFSPYVAVFRDASGNLLEHPRETSVLSSAAPNLYKLYPPLSDSEIDEIMLRRIQKVLCVAAAFGERSLTLGAWGCGAFGHDARRIAGLFHRALVDMNLQSWFDLVVFAVLDHSHSRANLRAFEEAFADVRTELPEGRGSAPKAVVRRALV